MNYQTYPLSPKGLVRLEIRIQTHFFTDEKTEVTEKLCLAQGYTAK